MVGIDGQNGGTLVTVDQDALVFGQLCADGVAGNGATTLGQIDVAILGAVDFNGVDVADFVRGFAGQFGQVFGHNHW